MGSSASTGLLPHPKVETSFGPVEGKRVLMPDGKSVANVFLGVPFAKPPIKERRFKKPEMPDRWAKTLICRSYKRRAVQTRTPWDLIDVGFTDEDCLYLNIVGPAKASENFPAGYPALVYIHGNFGLWDQVFALRFIHDNIRLFGGDPDKVTLYGQNLFQQTICIAGFSSSIWSVNDKRFAVETCRKKALQLGFKRLSKDAEWTDEESKQCIEYLRKLPSSKFGLTMIGEKDMIKNMRLRVAPVLDGELLPGSLKELIEKAPDRKEIVGCTAQEGLIFMALLGVQSSSKTMNALIDNSYDQIEFWANIRGAEVPMTKEAFKNLYGINDMMLKDRKKVRATLVQMISDFVTNVAIHNHCTKSLERKGSVCYRYYWEHYNRMITSFLNPAFPFVAATHGAELPFLFNTNIYVSPWYKTKADRQVQEIVTQMFTSFAIYGDPNGSPETKDFKFRWEPISFEAPERHLVIAREPYMRDNTGHSHRLERLSIALDLLML